MTGWAFVAALLLLPLCGCGGLVAAGSGIGALALVNQVSGDVNQVIDTACSAYEKGRAVADAVVATGLVPGDDVNKVGIIEQYGDAACASPPTGDALSTAIWFGKLLGQLDSLISGKTAS
jgi:hypothetical protein